MNYTIDMSPDNLSRAKKRIDEMVAQAEAGNACWVDNSASGFLYYLLYEDLEVKWK